MNGYTMKHRLSHVLEMEKMPSIELKLRRPALEIYADPKCPIYTYIASLKSESSQKTVKYALSALANRLNLDSIYKINWQFVDHSFVNLLINKLATTAAPNTINLYLTIFKRIAKEAHYLGMLTRTQLDRINDVKGISHSREKEHSILTHIEFEQALKACDDGSNLGIRDKAILAITVGCGLRRFETAKLLLEDVNFDECEIEVKGKGGKYRIIPLHPITMDQIKPWLKIRGNGNGPLFLPVFKNNQINFNRLTNGTTMSSNSIYLCCTRRGLIHGDVHVPPHSLRRTYASWLYKSKVSLNEIRLLLGHSSIETTKRYVVTSREELQASVVNNLFPK